MRRRPAALAPLAPMVLIAVAALGPLCQTAAASPVPDAKAEVQRLIDRPINAALLYHRLWTLHDSRIAMFEQATAEEELDFDDPEWAPDEGLSEVLEHLQPFVRDVLVAAAQPEADWGIEYAKGVEAMLPHLGQLRRVERILRADARRLVAAGEDEAAADRIVALHRMSTQSRRDAILISAVVNNSMGMRASMDTRILAVFYEINDDARRTLLRAIDALPAEDRHGIEYAIAIEPPFFAAWIRRTFTEDRPGERLIEVMMVEDEAKAADVRAMTRADLTRELERFERFGDRIVSVWNDPEVFVRLSELERSLEAGEYGYIAPLMAPAFTRVRQQAERADRDLQRARAALLREDD